MCSYVYIRLKRYNILQRILIKSTLGVLYVSYEMNVYSKLHNL